MRSATFDIETTDLAAVGSGVLLCAVVQPSDLPEPRVFQVELPFSLDHEGQMLTELLPYLYSFDILIGHNIQKFDLPFLLTRALRLGVPLPTKAAPLIYDTMAGFKRTALRTRLNGFGKPSAALAMIADLLGIPQEKTALYPAEQWSIVWNDSREALDALVDHCLRDVRMTVEVFKRVFSLDGKAALRRF